MLLTRYSPPQHLNVTFRIPRPRPLPLPPLPPTPQAICLYSAGAAYSAHLFRDYTFEAGTGSWVPVEADAFNFTGQTFALTFTSATEERFTTIPINLDGRLTDPAVTAAYIDAALEGLPNGVIDSVSVSVEPNSDGTAIFGESIEDFPCDELIVVTFDGTQVRYFGCGACLISRGLI